MNIQEPKPQKFYRYAIIMIASIFAIYAAIDGFSSAVDFITPSIAIIGTIVSIILIIFSFFNFSIPWKTKTGELVTITKLGIKFRLPLFGLILALWLPIWFTSTEVISKVDNEANLKSFSPIFSPKDSTSFNILIIRFEDFIADKNTYCIGRSLEEYLLVSKANDSTLTSLKIEYVSDSIPPPKTIEQARIIEKQHNADLIIYGLAQNIKDDCEGAEICFRYGISENLVDNVKPAIDIKSEKFDLDFIDTTPSKISLGQISIDFLSLNSWISSLYKVKLGNKAQAFLELDRIAMDTTINTEERSKRFFEIGNTYYSLNEVKKSIKAYDSAIYYNPQYYKAYHNRGISFWVFAENDKAKEDLQFSISSDWEGNHLSNYIKGLILNEENKFEKASKNFEMALLKDSTNLDYYLQLGNSYLSQHLPYKSFEVLKKSLKIVEVDTAKIYMEMAKVFSYQELYQDALRIQNMVILKNPNYSEYYISRALTKVKLRNFDSALGDLDKAIEADPNNNSAYFYCGYVYERKRDFKLAIKEYDKLISLFPNNPWAYTQRGRTHVESNNLEAAFSDFNTVIEIDSIYGDAYKERAFMYVGKGRNDLAFKDYNKALNINPYNLNYKAAKIMLLIKVGKLKEADKILSSLSEIEKKSKIFYTVITHYNNIVREENMRS